MEVFKQYLFGFFGSQLKFPLVNHSGHVIEPSAKKHPWETHEGYELAFTIKGKIIYECQDHSDVIVPGGNLSIFKPGEAHRGKEGIFYPCNLYWILLNPFTEQSVSGTPYSASELEEVYKTIEASESRVARATPFLMQLLEQYGNALNEWRTYDKRPALNPDQLALCSPKLVAWIKTLIMTIVIEAVHSFEAAISNSGNSYVQRACAYMEENFMDDINIHDVVSHLGVSEVYLYKNFEKETGQTPNGYLHNLRLEKACDLLAHTEDSITTIAMETGFSSSQYFTNVFKKYAGETPTAFRRRIPGVAREN